MLDGLHLIRRSLVFRPDLKIDFHDRKLGDIYQEFLWLSGAMDGKVHAGRPSWDLLRGVGVNTDRSPVGLSVSAHDGTRKDVTYDRISQAEV